MKKILLFACVCTSLTLTSCGITSAPVAGAIFTDVTSGQEVTGNRIAQKVGRSSAMGVLNLVAVGDASYQTAAKNAGITRISHIDKRDYTILGVYTTYETIVYGE